MYTCKYQLFSWPAYIWIFFVVEEINYDALIQLALFWTVIWQQHKNKNKKQKQNKKTIANLNTIYTI